MLTAMREGAKSGLSKIILFGLMVMAVFGLVLMDVGGFFRGGVAANSVAKVAGEQIPTVTFDNTVRRVLSSQGMDPQMAYQLGFIDQILNNQISEALLSKSARDLGIYVGDKEIAEQIQKIVKPHINDQISAKDVFARILTSQNMTESQFVQMLRNEVSTSMLRNTIALSAAVPSDLEIRNMYIYENEKRTAALTILPYSKAEGVKEPKDEVLLPFYQAGQEKYAIPETRKFTVALLTQDAIKGEIDVSDEELKEIYESEIATYTQAERRVLQQAILESQDKAQEVVDAVKGGKSLKDAVKVATKGDDAYIGEDKFEKAGLLEQIADSAFSLKKGEVSPPIESPLGWHVIVMKDTVPESVKPFNSIKDSIKKDIIQERLSGQMLATANMIDDAIAGGTSLEDIAGEYKLKTQNFGPVRADGSMTDGKKSFDEFAADNALVLQTAFELAEMETAPIFELADGRYILIRADKINEKSYTPFDDVKAELAKLWLADQRDVITKRHADELIEKVKSGEIAWDSLSKEKGTNNPTTMTMSRSDEVAAPLTDAAKLALFDSTKDSYILIKVQDGYAIAKVTDIKLPEQPKLSEDDLKKERESNVKQVQSEVFDLYTASLREKYGVSVNRSTLDTIYAPQTTQ